jgi:hypothetical protein
MALEDVASRLLQLAYGGARSAPLKMAPARRTRWDHRQSSLSKMTDLNRPSTSPWLCRQGLTTHVIGPCLYLKMIEGVVATALTEAEHFQGRGISIAALRLARLIKATVVLDRGHLLATFRG